MVQAGVCLNGKTIQQSGNEAIVQQPLLLGRNAHIGVRLVMVGNDEVSVVDVTSKVR